MVVLTLLLVAAQPLPAAYPVLERVVVHNAPDSAEDRCTGMVVEDDGAAYLGGYCFGQVTDFDFCLVRTGESGAVVGVQRYGSPLDSEDRLWCIAPGPGAGCVGAGGSIADTSRGWDYVVARYSPDGDTVWLRRFDSPEHTDDKPAGIATGPAGIAVTGRSRRRDAAGRDTDRDIWTLMLTPGGDTAWTRRWEGDAGGDDRGTGVVQDDSGNCYVVGTTGAAPRGSDVVLIRYGPDGTRRWTRTLSGDAAGSDLAGGLLRDGGRLLVWGAVYNRGTGFDYFAACYSDVGDELWRGVLDGTGKVDICQAAALDGDANLVITGQSTGRSFDILTAKYSPEGETLWTRRYDTGAEDRGWCVTTDERGNVYVGGTTVGANGFRDMVIVRYSAAGVKEWEYRYSGGGAGEARPVALTVKGDRLYVGGYAKMPATGFDFVLLRLRLGG